MQTEILNVSGMTCGGCTGSVTKALNGVDGVGNVEVSLSTGEATVQYDERRVSPDQLKAAVTQAGYTVTKTDINPTPKGKNGCCGGCS